jgi:hypothetical protein
MNFAGFLFVFGDRVVDCLLFGLSMISLFRYNCCFLFMSSSFGVNISNCKSFKFPPLLPGLLSSTYKFEVASWLLSRFDFAIFLDPQMALLVLLYDEAAQISTSGLLFY